MGTPTYYFVQFNPKTAWSTNDILRPISYQMTVVCGGRHVFRWSVLPEMFIWAHLINPVTIDWTGTRGHAVLVLPNSQNSEPLLFEMSDNPFCCDNMDLDLNENEEHLCDALCLFERTSLSLSYLKLFTELNEFTEVYRTEIAQVIFVAAKIVLLRDRTGDPPG